ncbi:ImmA/IrrE family metallo-endopeptidase [Actinocrinis puniceicyclus]|uniref:ImmA/IrrE family metallo-endopeptidase n=1 Tax=Actinocrinis puniceicyclus TaxID=977794 RepID=A0A8J7WN42_9ACTN|nr:XRE family transcriptional regulator [Actinocrinis puniceicyclus]MBS2962879.1 ImmA/IrrE family metallo-endopeptidase [Actinocrinis puniceicyclus]
MCEVSTQPGRSIMERVRLSSWAQIGARVALARERAGFTQFQLGDRLGLHRSAVSRVEAGQRPLDALELARVAEVFGRSVDWFLTQPASVIASRRDGLSRDHDVLRLEDELERVSRDVELLHEVRTLCLPVSLLPSGVSDLDEAAAGAAAARGLLGVDSGPLLDLQGAVEKVGLLAFSFDLGPSVIDGGYVRVGDIGVALVNGTADPGRRRFNLAHELGHHLLADEYTADFGVGTARDDRESLINAFAAHLLMPGPSLRARWTQLSAGCEDFRTRLIVLAAEYRVSWSAAVSQALTLGLITRADFDLLQARRPTPADYFEIGIRFEEELKPVALAPGYAQAAVRAYRRGVISADRTIELLRNTVTAEDLPVANETPLEALKPDFESIA